MKKVKTISEQLNNKWFYSTKENLSSDGILKGLLDHGLFTEKIPPCFISVGLTKYVKGSMDSLLDEVDNNKLNKELNKRAHDYMRYEALRDSNVPRHMGIPHPEAYAVQALAIAKHWKTIAEHCNKPDPVFSRIHVRNIVGVDRIFEMNYKGSDRFLHEENELTWMFGSQYMVAADISTCFPSIYTHSIPWALDGKISGKSNHSLSTLSNLLDKCTQNTRDRQTNGLLIGPHASNIISEIILTKIDADLQKKGHCKVVRHIDDYRFYAATLEEAERFIRNLGLALRGYEMSLNEKKTKILSLPRPSEENWILMLHRHSPKKNQQELRFSEIKSFLDLALTCAQAIGKSTPINYAIKMLANTRDQADVASNTVALHKFNARAKRMYAQEVMNLALSYPYLVPLVDDCVFSPCWHADLKNKIVEFATDLIEIGIRKLYPDTIAHAIFFALKHKFSLKLKDDKLIEILALDDCIANVLLFEYAKLHKQQSVILEITRRAKQLLKADVRDQDRQWLLIYQVWSEDELGTGKQEFLAYLKSKKFQFFHLRDNESHT